MRWSAAILLVIPLHAVADCDALLEEAGRIGDLLNNDPALGLERAADGIARARASGCNEALAAMHAAHGDNLNVLGRRAEARAAYMEAVDLLRGMEHGRTYASVIRRLAINLSQSGEYDTALEYFLESLDISEALDDRGAIGNTAGNIGSLLSQMGDLERAAGYFERAGEAHAETENDFGLASVSINLGTLHLRMADRAGDDGDADAERAHREQALEYNLDALGRFEELDVPRGIASASTNAGTAEWQLGRPERALLHHRRALEISERTGNHIGRFTAHLQLANALTALGRFDEARTHLGHADALAQDSPLEHQAGLAEAWVGLEAASGNHAAALEHQREVTRLQARIADTDHQTRVSALQLEHESLRREQELALLRNQGDITRLQLERQELMLRVGAIIALLLAALFIVLLNRYRMGVETTRRLEHAARTDSMTGLPNRRDMQEKIEYELQRTRRNTRPFSLLMIDLDEFKRVNDTHGHATGDALLIAVAARLREGLRAQDTVARWGGEEFLALLPETAADGATTIADKLRRAFDGKALTAENAAFKVTITIGVAQSWPGMNADEIIAAADRAMYRGKRAGRNRVVLENSR